MRSLFTVSFLLLGVVCCRNLRFQDVVNFNVESMTSEEDTHFPCNREIGVFFDSSNSLSADTYKDLQNFLSTRFLQNFTHNERLTIGTFGEGLNWYGFNSETGGLSWNGRDDDPGYDIPGFINEQEQSDSATDFEFVFGVLADGTHNYWLAPKTIILITGKLYADDALLANEYAEELKRKWTFLSIIGVQGSVDLGILETLADYAYSFDISRGIPENIQDVITRASGCDF